MFKLFKIKRKKGQNEKQFKKTRWKKIKKNNEKC